MSLCTIKNYIILLFNSFLHFNFLCRCSIGSWTMSQFDINISNVSQLLLGHKNETSPMKQYPLSLIATATKEHLSDIAGVARTGISNRRAFHCLNRDVELNFPDVKKINLVNSTPDYTVELGLIFRSIKLQPFLVDESELFSDPQFCE